MIPLIRQLVNSLLWDADAARRWVSMLVGMIGASGATFSEQIAEIVDCPRLVIAIRLASFVAVAISSAFSPARQTWK